MQKEQKTFIRIDGLPNAERKQNKNNSGNTHRFPIFEHNCESLKKSLQELPNGSRN